MNKPLAYTYFIAGIIFCILIYLVFQRSDIPQFTRILFVAGFIVLLFVWRWIESRLHIHYLNSWNRIRQSGKLTFILARYVLLRGIILSILFVVPSYSRLEIQTVLFLIVFIIIISSTLGNQEWTDCENHYQASLLHDAATSLRAMQN